MQFACHKTYVLKVQFVFGGSSGNNRFDKTGS